MARKVDDQQSYSFRNRFRLGENQRLDSGDALEIQLTASNDETVVIKGAKSPSGEEKRFGTPVIISRTDELILLGGEYADPDSAAAAGRKWRQIMLVAMARENLSVEFGPDNRLEPQAEITYAEKQDPPELLRQIGVKAGDRVIWDDGHKLTVHRTRPEPKFISAEIGPVTVSLSGWLSRFQERVHAAERAYTPWSERKQLAYRLTHSALRDPNPETRHVQLVTAAEVLVDEQDRPADVAQALKAVLNHIEGWAESPPDKAISESTLNRLKQILHENKRESITQAGAQYARDALEGNYGGADGGEFFKTIYNQRSRLVHKLKRKQERPSVEQLQNVYYELLRFVLDLLDATTE